MSLPIHDGDTRDLKVGTSSRKIIVTGKEVKRVTSTSSEVEDNEDEQNSENGSIEGSQQEQQNTLENPTIYGVTPFTDSTEVTMSGPEDAEIYYTTDGSTPSAQSTLYEGGFVLNATTTVKAIAIKNGVSSEVTTKEFDKSSGGSSGFDTGS